MSHSHDPEAIKNHLHSLRPRVTGRVPAWVAAACLSCGLATACTTPTESGTTPDTAVPREPSTPDEPAGKKGADMYAAPDDGMDADMGPCHDCMEYAAPPVAEYGGPPMEDE